MAEPYMTLAEIEAKYPNQWVLIANPHFTRGYEVRGGHVVLHSADRTEFLQQAGAWDDPTVKQTASCYTGKIGAGFEAIAPTDAEPGAA